MDTLVIKIIDKAGANLVVVNCGVSSKALEVAREDFGELDFVDERDVGRHVDAGGREALGNEEPPLAADFHALDALLDALAEYVLEGPIAVFKGDGFVGFGVVDDFVADDDLCVEADDVARERRGAGLGH